MNKYMYFALVYLIALLALLSNVISCAMTAEELLQQQEQMHKAMNYCNYNAVELGTDRILCKAGDCVCHDSIANAAFKRTNMNFKRKYDKFY